MTHDPSTFSMSGRYKKKLCKKKDIALVEKDSESMHQQFFDFLFEYPPLFHIFIQKLELVIDLSLCYFFYKVSISRKIRKHSLFFTFLKFFHFYLKVKENTKCFCKKNTKKCTKIAIFISQESVSFSNFLFFFASNFNSRK